MVMKEEKPVENQFLGFYKFQRTHNNQGFKNALLFTILSVLTLSFSIYTPLLFFVSIPITIMSVVGIYFSVKNHKDYIQYNINEEEKEKEQKLIEKEQNVFNSLSIEKQKSYLKKNPESIISNYVESHLEKKEEIILLKNLIKIETDLKKKFDDKFYSDINLINFNDKLNLILDIIKEQNSAKLFSEVGVLKQKIKFFTFFQIFDEDLYKVELQILRTETTYLEDLINRSFDINSSINDNFIIKLKETLKLKVNPNDGGYIAGARLSRSGNSISLQGLMTNFLIENYDKIVGNNLRIKKLNELFNKFKHLDSRFIFFSEEKENSDWNYKFYEQKNKPDVSKGFNGLEYTDEVVITGDKKFTIVGDDVLNEITVILEE